MDRTDPPLARCSVPPYSLRTVVAAKRPLAPKAQQRQPFTTAVGTYAVDHAEDAGEYEAGAGAQAEPDAITDGGIWSIGYIGPLDFE